MTFDQSFLRNTSINEQMLDLICKEYIFKILEQLLAKFKELKFSLDEIGQILDSADCHGFAMVHYLTCQNYSEAISLVHKHGANLNLMSRDNYPLTIAVSKGHEQSVQTLIQCGASLNPKANQEKTQVL